jgi:hypothetical protein
MQPLRAVPFDAPQPVHGIAGIVEMDLDIRPVVRNPLAGLGPVGIPAFVPQLPQSIRVERVLGADIAFDQLPVVQNSPPRES